MVLLHLCSCRMVTGWRRSCGALPFPEAASTSELWQQAIWVDTFGSRTSQYFSPCHPVGTGGGWGSTDHEAVVLSLKGYLPHLSMFPEGEFALPLHTAICPHSPFPLGSQVCLSSHQTPGATHTTLSYANCWNREILVGHACPPLWAASLLGCWVLDSPPTWEGSGCPSCAVKSSRGMAVCWPCTLLLNPLSPSLAHSFSLYF